MNREEQLRHALRTHHPIMRSETGPFSGCRCGQVRLGQDVIAHVVDQLRAALTEETPLACWEKQLLYGEQFPCALPTGHDGPCQREGES